MTSQKNKKKLIFLVHEGSAQTNLKAVKEAIDMGKLDAEISLVVSDKDNLPDLDEISPDYVCLAGWKKIIPEDLINKYKILTAQKDYGIKACMPRKQYKISWIKIPLMPALPYIS